MKFSAQKSDMAPGTKVKIPSEIKPPLAILHRKLDKNDVIFKYFNHNSISNICVVLFFRSSESSAWSSSSSSSSGEEEDDRPVGAGGSMAPPDFDRSVNPISTRGADYPHHITTGPLGFSDLPTALEEEETSDEDEPGMEPIKVANSSPSATRTSLKKKSKKNMSLRRKAEALLRLASAKSDDKSLSATASSTTNSCLPSAASTNVAKV